MRFGFAPVVAAVCVAQTATAQVVHGVLLSAANNQPVPYGTVRTVAGTDTIARFTNASGQFALGELGTGTYRLHARMLGYAPLDTTITVDAARTPLVLRIAPTALRLATVPVRAKRNACVGGIPSAATDPVLAAIFDQVRINVERYHLVMQKYPFRFRRQEAGYVRIGTADSLKWIDTTEYDVRELRPYRLGSVVYHDSLVKDAQSMTQRMTTYGSGVYHDSVPGPVRRTVARRTLMYLPTFADLADSTFDAAHCFSYAGRKAGTIQIDFRPA